MKGDNKMADLQITYLPTEQITPYEHNAKVHNGKQTYQRNH